MYGDGPVGVARQRNQIVNKLIAAALSISALNSACPALPAQRGQLATDWLIDPPPFKAASHEDPGARELVLDKGLIRRVWRIEPDAACISESGKDPIDYRLSRDYAVELNLTVPARGMTWFAIK